WGGWRRGVGVGGVLGWLGPPAATRCELRSLTQALEETRRMEPASPILLRRRAARPVVLGPWQFPARTLFMLPLQLMQRDARWFDAPDVFRPERFADDVPAAPRGTSLPFGPGPRVCLGQHLAMTEMTVVAAMILQRYALSAPPGGVPPRPVLNVTLRPDRPLHLAIAPTDERSA
ncbi:cytochrome P450, partial [Burkholderia contaminans]